MAIGEGYLRRVESLKDKIRSGEILSYERKALKDNSCYFCRLGLDEEEKMFVLKESKKKADSFYYLHKECYYATLGAQIVKLGILENLISMN